MKLPADLLDLPPARAARRIALAQLSAARAASRRLADSGDREALHDFRVAVRRLRSTLRAWRPELRGAARKRDRRALRELQAATGAGRDSEAALALLASLEPRAGPAARRAIEHLRPLLQPRRSRIDPAALRETYERARRRLHRSLKRGRAGKKAGGGTFASAAAERVRELLGVLQERLAAVRFHSDDAAAHRARIACKHARYVVEPLAASAPRAEQLLGRLKSLQETLGDLHDVHVLLSELRTPGADADTRALAADLDDRARVLFDTLRTTVLEDGGSSLVRLAAGADFTRA